MRFAALFAALALAILAAFSARARAGAERAEPRLRRDRRRSSRPPSAPGREIWMFATAFNDRFFTYSYPAAARRRDRLVRDPAAPTAAATSSRPGARSPTPTAACPGDPELPGALGDRDLRLPLVPGRRRRCSPSSAARATATRPATSRTRRSTPRRRTAPSTSARAPATSASAPRPARSACASSPTRASTPRAWEKIGGWEGYAAFLSDDPTSPDSRLNRLWDGSVEPPVPHRHGLRRLPHRLRPAEAAGRPDTSGLGEHRRAGRQPVQPRLRAARQRPLAAPAGVAADRPRPPRHRRHLGAADGLRLQPRHDERDHQLRPPAAARGRGPEVAQGLGLRRRRRPRGLLVRAGPRGQVLGEEPKTETVPHVLKGGEDFDRLRRRRSSASTSTSAPAPSSAGSTT